MAEVLPATHEVPPPAEAGPPAALVDGGERKRLRDEAGAEEPAADLPARRARVQEKEEEPEPPAGPPAHESEGPLSVPHLDEWKLVQGKTSCPYEAPELAPTLLCGVVRGHPHIIDGEIMWSSPIVWLDCGEELVAQTRSRQYTLGKLEDGFRSFLKERTDATSVALSSSDTSTTRRCYPNGS
jgi:hypothetical protein